MPVRPILVLFSFIFFLACSREKKSDLPSPTNEYNYQIDLTGLKNDKILVTLYPPALARDTAIFRFPKVIPGVYGSLDFGKNVENLSAFGPKHNELPVKPIDLNSWEILDTRQLRKVTYEVNDGWEEFIYETELLYRSAGSTFKKNKVFVINNNSLLGYFEGLEKNTFNLHIKKPEGLWASTSFRPVSQKNSEFSMTAHSYREIADHPILIAPPDTAAFRMGGIQVHVAAFSTSGKKISQEIADEIHPLLKNQKEYLGGQLPVENYTFLIYHNLNEVKGHFVADGLEHGSSTLILLNMPSDKEVICETVYGIASHEFFHTITPLAVHSQLIEDFDFDNPTMSKHLWLYEGMTEYFTMHMPVKQGITSVEEFLRECQRKISAMKEFDNSIPLTQLSEESLERQNEYYNFYLRGALVSLCLDIRLRELSHGEYGVQNLIGDLMREYGKNKPFPEDELFPKIVELTHPEIEIFLENYVAGSEPLPIEEYFVKAGINYKENPLHLRPASNAAGAQLQLRKSWINH